VNRTTDTAKSTKNSIGYVWESVVRDAKKVMTFVVSLLKFQKFVGHVQYIAARIMRNVS
jgi:hypothetical protein